MGSRNLTVTIDDIYVLLGLRTNRYFRSNAYVEMSLNHNGQARDFCFCHWQEPCKKINF